MYCVREVTKNLYWVGANDRRLHLFENIHPIPRGVSYNAYVLLDKKTVLFDTVDWAVCRQFLENVDHVLKGRRLDYMVINHMEPDHCASIEEIVLRHPEVKIISTEKSFMLMRQFGFHIDNQECIEVKEGDTQCFGDHTVTFVEAPMVHWPEAMVTLDLTNGALFSADAFGSFISLDGHLFADEVNFDRDWIDEARRYYTNIVGKYGPHVQLLLGKAATVLDKIKFICPSMVPYGAVISGTFSTSIPIGVRTNRKKKACLSCMRPCMAIRKQLHRIWPAAFVKKVLPTSASTTYRRHTYRNLFLKPSNILISSWHR